MLVGPVQSAYAATITVTTANSTIGPGDGVSLAEAIRSINTGANINADVVAAGPYGSDDTIQFNIPGSGVQSTGGLPVITRPVLIDGYTQPGASVNTLPIGENAAILIQVSGDGLEDPSTLTIDADNVTVRGLDIVCPASNTATGIMLRPSRARATITGNRLAGYNCLSVNDAPNVIIGGATPALRNDIHASGAAPGTSAWVPVGISIRGVGSAGAVVQGNVIRADSVRCRPTFILGTAVSVQDAPNVTIGGTTPGAGNVVSNLSVAGVSATGATIQGNLVGTNEAGQALGSYSGIVVSAPSALIGGTERGAGNIASGISGPGISVSGTGSRVQGNVVGLRPGGTGALGNGCCITDCIPGFSLNSPALTVGGSGITIGGTEPGAGNIVSGNSRATGGIEISGAGTGAVIQGNLIGLNPAGSGAIPNAGWGIAVAAANVTIGGTVPGARNVISGNGGGGIVISGAGASGTVVKGNLIGTDAAGTAPVGNARGIAIGDASNVSIGGPEAGVWNIIAFNTQSGVTVTTSSGPATGNAIRGNSIFGNHRIGIDLGDNGLTPNDASDGDTGPNQLQNFPVLSSASVGAGMTRVVGTLNSTPNTVFALDFFSGHGCDADGAGGRQIYLGSTNATTDGVGNASFATTGLVAATDDDTVTATATDPNGNTSEPGACQAVATAGVAASPTSLLVAEGGGGGSFAAALTSVPTSPVTVTPSFDSSVLNVSPPVLVFPAGAAPTPQTVTVTAVDNPTVNGTRTPQVAFTASSTDPQYNGIAINPVTVTIIDNEAAQGFIVSPTSGLVTTEAGGQATFTVKMAVVPTAPVTIPLSSSNPAEGSASPSSLTFAADSSALSPQTVTVTGVNDAVADGDVAYAVMLGAVQSDDPSYNGVDPPDVSVTNRAVNSAVNCSPRPRVVVTTDKTDDGRLHVTVAVSTTQPGPQNHLAQLQFDAGTNANVQIPGQPTRTGPFTFNLPGGVQGFEFFVGRLGPGATNLPFQVIDGCGSSQPWRTFVGGGPTAF